VPPDAVEGDIQFAVAPEPATLQGADHPAFRGFTITAGDHPVEE